MSKLGGFFPQQWNDELAKERLRPGSVIRLFVHDTTPPKIKRFVIAGVAYNKITIATTYINTSVTPNVFTTGELQRLHMPLVADERNIVDHDSFINCSRLFEKSTDELLKLLQADPSVHLGYLTEAEFKELKMLIKSARTISPDMKKKYGLFL